MVDLQGFEAIVTANLIFDEISYISFTILYLNIYSQNSDVGYGNVNSTFSASQYVSCHSINPECTIGIMDPLLSMSE